jgi:hyperosmotically inducible periplasmic protein
MRAPLLIVLGLMFPAASTAAPDLAKEVRHEVLLVPGYTVYDWLYYRIDGSKVTLLGTVVHANLKRDVENAVKRIDGVTSVENDIEVLPASASDDRIRQAILQSINKEMSAYLSEEVKRIHIIVKNGNVMLEGEASSQADKERVTALAKFAPEVRNVTNNLVVQK